jgi:hypothetical protein
MFMALPEHVVQQFGKAKVASESCIGRHPSVSLATALLLGAFVGWWIKRN